ncbi:MAG: hypothetical protein ACTTI6_09750 [Treponema sp.]|uniref:hypothetical protein n=1 Tax=Treponema sp. TaxID=166 RepID=UPI003FA26A8C
MKDEIDSVENHRQRKTSHKKPRSKIDREKHLAAIALFERTYPTKYANLELFAEAVSKQLHISVSVAKKDIQEVHRRRKQAAEIDQKYELGKKLEELAAVKEAALATNNMNAYLGAINKECELLGLDKLSIFVGTQEDMELSLALKKKAISDKLTLANTNTPSKEPESLVAQDGESQGTENPQKENA